MGMWVEDQGLTKRVLEDFAAQLEVGQVAYRERYPHMSELNSCLTQKFYDRTGPLPYSPQETLLFITGQGMETLLIRPHGDGLKGETDGIHWSVDWMEGDHPGELKSTRISMKRDPYEFPITWKRQMLSYLKVTGKTEVSLAIIHLMGGYSPPFPELRCWKGTFSQEEIDENWEWFLERKEIYVKAIEENVAPTQFKYNEEYECQYCRYLFICQAKQSIEDLERGKAQDEEGNIVQWRARDD